MARNNTNMTPEQVAAQSQHPLDDVVLSANSVTNQGGYGGTQVPKHAVSGDPAWQAHPQRNPVIDENIGASYQGVKYGLNRDLDPAISSTMINARVIPPKISREDSFEQGGVY